MPSHSAVFAASIPLLALLGACASTPSSRVPEGEVPGMAGRECHYADVPDAVGPGTLAPVTDPDWLAGAALEAGVTGPVTLSIRYDDDGVLEWVRPMALADDSSHRLARAVHAAAPARRGEGAGGAWGVRIRYVPDGPSRVAPAVLCEVMAEDAASIRPAAGRVDMDGMPLTKNGRLTYVVWVEVGPDGRAIRANLSPTSAHKGNLGLLLKEAAMDHRYRPALHDGFPVRGRYTLTREIRWRTEARSVRGSRGHE